MNNNEELYGDLFAYRIYLSDIYDNEREIIKKLKIKLYELGNDIANINVLLYNFYRFYEIPDITMEMIESSNAYIYMRSDNMTELFMRLISQLNIRYNEEESTLTRLNLNEEDEKTTLNEEEFNELEIMELEEDIDNDCSICIDNLRKGNEVIKLKCNHIFHKECIKSYLLNYDNKCPLCRNNVLNETNNITNDITNVENSLNELL
jgi:hypothetical protein